MLPKPPPKPPKIVLKTKVIRDDAGLPFLMLPVLLLLAFLLAGCTGVDLKPTVKGQRDALRLLRADYVKAGRVDLPAPLLKARVTLIDEIDKEATLALGGKK